MWEQMYKFLLLLHEILHTGSKNWRGLFQAFCLIDIPCALTIWSYFCSPIFVFWRCLFWFCFCCCWGFFGGGFGGVQWLYECSFLHTTYYNLISLNWSVHFILHPIIGDLLLFKATVFYFKNWLSKNSLHLIGKFEFDLIFIYFSDSCLMIWVSLGKGVQFY